MQFRHIGWCNYARVMQLRQSIFYLLYLCISPGALGFNLGKCRKLQFAGRFLECQLNTLVQNPPKSPQRDFLAMAAIATGRVLHYPKITLLQLLKYLSQKDNNHVLNDTKHNEIVNSIFTHNSEGENQILLLLQSKHYYRHPNVIQLAFEMWVLLQISIINSWMISFKDWDATSENKIPWRPN